MTGRKSGGASSESIPNKYKQKDFRSPLINSRFSTVTELFDENLWEKVITHNHTVYYPSAALFSFDLQRLKATLNENENVNQSC